MGAYSPAPVVTDELHARIMREVMHPTAQGLISDDTPYVGFLYAGLMIAADGTPNVLEFNCRFGDPETQPILSRLRSDIVSLCEAALDGKLGKTQAELTEREEKAFERAMRFADWMQPPHCLARCFMPARAWMVTRC